MEVLTNSTIGDENIYSYIGDIFTNPFLITIILAYIIIFYFLGNPSTSISQSPPENNYMLIVIVVIGVVGLLIAINSFKAFFGMDMVSYIEQIVKGGSDLNIVLNKNGPPNSNPKKKSSIVGDEVFNIPGNYYTYNESDTLCKAYNARLATYDELEQSYNKGADWCNYGWSAKQLALFPTQKKTYDTLQGIKGHENDCGRPGINGGYIANPNVKFGVNCYGRKPKITPEESDLMATSSIYPKTEADILLEKQLNYWKSKINEILVSPFNHFKWSKY
jgi:hypothetical protein